MAFYNHLKNRHIFVQGGVFALDGYIQIKEAAKKWEIGERRINELCLNGRIKGAVKFGNTWAIPKDSEKPADARIKSGKYIKDRGEKI